MEVVTRILLGEMFLVVTEEDYSIYPLLSLPKQFFQILDIVDPLWIRKSQSSEIEAMIRARGKGVGEVRKGFKPNFHYQ